MGYSSWGYKESDTTERLTLSRARTCVKGHNLLIERDIFHPSLLFQMRKSMSWDAH